MRRIRRGPPRAVAPATRWRRAGALIDFMNDQRLGNHVFDSHAGIKRSEGILKDDLHIAAEATHFGMIGGEQVAAFEHDMPPEVGSIRRRIKRPSVLLPDPDSPTKPKVSPDSMSKETSSTARTSPLAPRRKWIRRARRPSSVANFEQRHDEMLTGKTARDDPDQTNHIFWNVECTAISSQSAAPPAGRRTCRHPSSE